MSGGSFERLLRPVRAQSLDLAVLGADRKQLSDQLAARLASFFEVLPILKKLFQLTLCSPI